MPLIDASGSTIGLVNAAQINSGPVTTYAYDPSGNFSVSGSANIWPFLFEGGEHEVTDPASLYYDGSGNFYDPQIQRELAQLDATGLSQPNLGSVGGTAGANGGGGSARHGTGSVSGPRAAHAASYRSAQEGDEGEGGCDGCYNPSGGDLLIQILDWLGQLLNDIFGGGGSSLPTPRQLLYQRHPLYPVILGVSEDLIPTEAPPRPQDPCDDVPGSRSVLNRNIQLARRHPWPWYLAPRSSEGTNRACAAIGSMVVAGLSATS